MDNSNIKTILIKRKEQLQHELEQIKEAAAPVDLKDPIGRLSRMDAIQQQQIVLNSKKSLLLSLELIESAMKRLKNDEYGYCLKCEEEISSQRLKARPEVSFCINCQK